MVSGHDGADRGDASHDAVIERLVRSFVSDPEWRRAAKEIDEEAESDVYFSHRPGEAWHLRVVDGQVVLQPGTSADPDFVFRFSPGAVARLAGEQGNRGAVAIALFGLMESPHAEERVDFRVAAPFARLVRRGYLRLLLSSGARLLAFGLAHGVASVLAVRRLVAASRRRGAFDWEQPRGARVKC